jgi:hypothetical protein
MGRVKAWKELQCDLYCLYSQSGKGQSIVRSWETVRSSSDNSARSAEEQSEDTTMAATTTTTTSSFSIPVSAQAESTVREIPNRRHRITPKAGHALEILGHAIEYMTDEFVYEDGALSARNAQLQAVQLLMALNRQVYFECPEVQTFSERCRALLHLHST